MKKAIPVKFSKNTRAKFALFAFLLLALVFPAPQAFSQNTRQVKGTVYDETGEPLPGAVIMNRKLKFGVSTGPDGHFVMTGVTGKDTATGNVCTFNGSFGTSCYYFQDYSDHTKRKLPITPVE